MKIGELARRLDVASSKIRFLEAEGLVRPVGRSAGGYREYDETSVAALEIILQAQSFGFTLQEIKGALADKTHNVHSHDYLIKRLSQKLNELDRHIAQVQDLRGRIVSAVADLKTRAKNPNGAGPIVACPTRRTAPRLKPRTAGQHSATGRAAMVRP